MKVGKNPFEGFDWSRDEGPLNIKQQVRLVSGAPGKHHIWGIRNMKGRETEYKILTIQADGHRGERKGYYKRDQLIPL